MNSTASSARKVKQPTRAQSTRWSDEDVSRLIDLWSTNLTNAEIAKKLDREESAVAVKASRINLPRRAKMNDSNSKAKVRPCLRCETPFYSTGPGNRFCDPCKESSEWKNGNDFYATIGSF